MGTLDGRKIVVNKNQWDRTPWLRRRKILRKLRRRGVEIIPSWTVPEGQALSIHPKGAE